MIKKSKFFLIILACSLALGFVFRFSVIRLVTLQENFADLRVEKGDQALVWVGSGVRSGWVVLQYPDFSRPYILRQVVPAKDEKEGSVEVPGEPMISVLKGYDEYVVTDGSLNAQYGDSRSWGKGVRFDLILGKAVILIPKGRFFSFHRWRFL